MNKYEIFIIMKKELAKFFGNKRMLFKTVAKRRRGSGFGLPNWGRSE